MLESKFFKKADGTPYLEIRLPNGDIVRRTIFTEIEQAEYDALSKTVPTEAGPTPITKEAKLPGLNKPL